MHLTNDNRALWRTTIWNDLHSGNFNGRITEIIHDLNKDFAVQPEVETLAHWTKYIDSYQTLSSLYNCFPVGVYKVAEAHPEARMLLLVVQWEVLTGNGKYAPRKKEYPYRLEFAAFVPLNRDYGHSVVRDETITDKVVEFVKPREIDFPRHPEFSRKFYCLSEQRRLFEQHAPLGLITALLPFSGFQMEFKARESFIVPKDEKFPAPAWKLAGMMKALFEQGC